MKIEKRKGQKVRFEIDRRYYVGVRTGVIDQVVRRGDVCKVRIISNSSDEGKRADHVNPEQVIAYFDDQTEQWHEIKPT